MTNPFNNGTEEVKVESSAELNPDAEVMTEELTEPKTEEKQEEIPDIIVSESQAGTVSKEEYDNLNSQYIRLAADFDNQRKRFAQERENLLKYGAENTLKKIIEVLDNFERGEKANETVEDCDKLRESFNLVHKQFVDVMKKAGVEEIDAEGKEFDPNYHEAVMRTPTNEHPEHTVITVLQKGYKLEDRVLRPALVNVAIAEG